MEEGYQDFELERPSHRESTVRLLEDEQVPTILKPSKRAKMVSKTLVAFMVSNSIWTAYLLLWSSRQSSTSCPAAKSGHVTDFTSILPSIKSPITTSFDDQLRYNITNHEFWRDLDLSAPQYFGPPSVMIDAAWADLLRGEFLGVSQQEILLNPELHFNDQDLNPITGNFHIAIDVFHSLHCLNAVRKQIDKDYYHPAPISVPVSLLNGNDNGTSTPTAKNNLSSAPTTTESPPSSSTQAPKTHHDALWSTPSQQRIHIDHCLNHIRQSLQCHPDLSPAAMKFQTSASGQVFYLGNSEQHTCADWQAIKQWMEQRRTSDLGAWEE